MAIPTDTFYGLARTIQSGAVDEFTALKGGETRGAA